MTKKDFELLARTVRGLDVDKVSSEARTHVAASLARALASTNASFDAVVSQFALMFVEFTCALLRGYDECDCPKCQGYCECSLPEDEREPEPTEPDPDYLYEKQRDERMEREWDKEVWFDD